MTARWLVLAILCAACGDNLHRPDDDPFTAVSGSRLALQRYRFDDGTEQVSATELYDTVAHSRCRPLPWTDGAMRCVPVADDAQFSDAGCTALVGVARTIARPTYFVVYDGPPAGGVVVRVVRAGAPTAAVTQTYALSQGACIGPTPIAPGPATFFAIGDEVNRTDLVAFHDDDLGVGRLGLVVRAADDGARVLSGLRDRELGAACVPGAQGDGSVACEPVGAPAASLFRDAACSEPMIAIAATEVPAIARLTEPSGCASYRRVGSEVAPPVYHRDGDACRPVDAPVGGRLFAVEEPVALPALDRALEDVPGRRLQRIVLGHGELRFVDDRLFDTGTGAACGPRAVRDTVRCLPTNLPAAITLYVGGCSTQIRVVEVAQRACEPVGFATTNRPFQVRAIGDRITDPVFRLEACQPYVGPPGTEIRALGPALDLATFPGAIYFSDR